MKKYINRIFQYIFGFSVLGGRKIIGFSKKSLNAIYKQIIVALPFLSQEDLFGWAKGLSNGIDNIYDKAMDAEYLKTHIGGAYHRLFDGGHSPVNAWEKVKNASDTDNLSQEVIGYFMGMWKDASTKMGMPFTTIDKEGFDKAAEVMSASIGVKKSWLYDLATWDVFEIFSTAMGFLGAIFFLKKEDMDKVSEILGSMGIISILSGNPLMGLAVMVQIVYAYIYKKKKLDNEKALKSAGLSTISWMIFATLGLPILIELVIVLVVFKLVKKQPIPGKEWVSHLINRYRTKDVIITV